MPLTNMTMETGDDKGAIGFVFIVERDAAGEGIGTMGVGYILGHVEIKVEEAGAVAHLGIFSDVRVGYKPPAMIGSGCYH